MIAVFENMAAFDAWHEEAKAELGIPYPLRQNGEVVPGEFATKYVEPIPHPTEDGVIAYVGEGVTYTGDTLTGDEAEAAGYWRGPDDLPE